MNRLWVLVLILFILLSGCTAQRKTKEQLVSEGIRLVHEHNPGGAIIFFKNALEKDQNYFEARFQLAKAYYAIGKFEAAEKELEKVRRQDPSSRDVKIEMARVLAHTKRPDEALKEISQYLGDDSIDCDSLEIAGWAHAVKEDFPGAVTLLKRACAACDGRTTPAISLASVYAMMGKTDEAERQIMSVLAKEPTDRRALYLLADIQISRKDRAAALQTLDRIIQASPNDIEAQYRKGLLQIEIKEYDNALSLSQAVIRQFPKRAEGHRLQGFAYFFKQQYIDAIPAFQRSLVLQPNPGACYILGLSHYYRNEEEQALNQFQKALEMNPSMTQARVHLALVLLNKKRTDDAIREVKTALSHDEKNAMAHNVLGSAYLTKGIYTEGIAELNKALELDPSLADIHIKKGLVAMKQGKGEEAESELTAAVHLKPEKQDARRMLSLYYLNNNEPAKAIDILRQGLQSGSSDAVSYYLMGESYLRQNDLNEARTYFIKAKEVEPKYDLAYFRLASIDFIQTKQEEGIKEIRSLLEQSPDNAQALLLLASFAEANSDENEARKYYLAAANTGKTEGIIVAALYLKRTNNIDKSLMLLNEGIKQSSADVRLYEVKGGILLASRNFKDALATFETVYRLNPQLGLGYLVNAYLAMGEQAKALEKVQTGIKGNPTDLGLRAELSRIYMLMGDKTEAIENARDIIKKNPESPVGYIALALVHESGNDVEQGIEVLRSAPKVRDVALTFTLGNLYARKKNYPAALEQYQRAEKMNSESDQILFQKGNIFYAMGRKKEAIDEYQKVLRLFPNHAMALNNLAYLFAEENRNPSQALMYATRAFMLAPQNDSIQDTLGYVLLKNGKTEQGMTILRKASENNPKNPSILYHLALGYTERGDSVKAVEQLQKALTLGDFPEARNARALLAKIRKSGNS